MISILLIILSFEIARSQPSNDDPCDAIEITGSLPLSFPASNIGGTVSALEDALPNCVTIISAGSPKVVWYKLYNVEGISIDTGNTHTYDTKITLWTVGDCNDPNTFECVDGNDDCSGFGLGSCVFGEDCYDEIYVMLHGFLAAEGTTDLVIDGTKNTFGCNDCGHTWNTGPNQPVQCISDDICCPALRCNIKNGKCNLKTALLTEHICGHIQNSGPNKDLNCNDDGTQCCDGFVCHVQNGKCLKKTGQETSFLALDRGVAEEPIGGGGEAVISDVNTGGESDSSDESVRSFARFESNMDDENGMKYDGDGSGVNNNNNSYNKLLITNIWAMFCVLLFVLLSLFCIHHRCNNNNKQHPIDIDV